MTGSLTSRLSPTVKIELQQVLINLITNAIQAMDEAGSTERIIRIAMERPDIEHVCICRA